MRNEKIHAYLIHHRKYRERSHIVHLFTEEYGRMDGILRQPPPPQYQPIELYATGKSALKNFTKLEIINQPVFFYGDAFFAGFYLNEIVLRLCALEEPMPESFAQYHHTLAQLQHLSDQAQVNEFLKQILRQFEFVLLEELGYALDYRVDAKQSDIQPQAFYQFQLNEGFVPVKTSQSSGFKGEQILTMLNYEKGQAFDAAQLAFLGRLYRQMISALMGDRPLKSRQLWIQNTQHRSLNVQS